MAKGGYRGMPMMGGMNMNMMKQAQKMQQELLKMQQEMETKELSASSGGGMVTATVNGRHEVTALEINPEAVDPDDVEMLQDLVIAAVNEAMRTAEADSCGFHVEADRRAEPERAAGTTRRFPAALERLTEQFARLPGDGQQVGAAAGVSDVLSMPDEEAEAFAGGDRRRQAQRSGPARSVRI